MKTIDKKDFNQMVKELSKFSNEREKLILLSREVVRISKQLIYSIHRKDMVKAQTHKKIIDKKYNDMIKLVSKKNNLILIGAYKVAVQEYVEAVCFLEFVKTGTLPTHITLNAKTELYLMGLCDLVGELMRNAINAGINEDFNKVLEIKQFVEDLYGEFIKFDFQGGELRKKYDSIKYFLNKLEDLVYDLKLKGKL